MHRKKHSVYRIQDDPQFKASSGSLGTYPPQTMSHSGVRINTYAARVENHWLLAQKGRVVCPATHRELTAELEPDFSSLSSTVLPCTLQSFLVLYSPSSSCHRPLHHARPHEQPAEKPGWPGPGDTAPRQLSV